LLCNYDGLAEGGGFWEALGAFIFIFLPEMNELNVSGLDKEAEVRGGRFGVVECSHPERECPSAAKKTSSVASAGRWGMGNEKQWHLQCFAQVAWHKF